MNLNGVLRYNKLALMHAQDNEFADNGKGINSDIKQRIFEPFFSTKPKGQGLGMAIVKEIMDCYKGNIEVENLSQGGARFTFSIPIGDIS